MTLLGASLSANMILMGTKSAVVTSGQVSWKMQMLIVGFTSHMHAQHNKQRSRQVTSEINESRRGDTVCPTNYLFVCSVHLVEF